MTLDKIVKFSIFTSSWHRVWAIFAYKIFFSVWTELLGSYLAHLQIIIMIVIISIIICQSPNEIHLRLNKRPAEFWNIWVFNIMTSLFHEKWRQKMNHVTERQKEQADLLLKSGGG